MSSQNLFFGQATIDTADGTYCLTQQEGVCRWVYASPDTSFWWAQAPNEFSPSPCDDPPGGYQSGISLVLYYDATSDMWGIWLHLEPIAGTLPPDGSNYVRVFEATFSFDCDTITVDNDLTEADGCITPQDWAVWGFGGTATITKTDCGTVTDICANTGSDDCANTVHVSATGGFFDGFEADITRTDTSTHDWGDSSSSYPFGGAYIQCIDGVLTLTFRSDDAGPCTIIFTADGTGACPTGRTWTFQSANEGCDPPTSVSVT
jgi:hypothetical protein